MLRNNKQLTDGNRLKSFSKFNTYNSSANNDNSIKDQYMTHSEYFLTQTPSFKTLIEQTYVDIEQTEQLVFSNRKLIECITRLTQLAFNEDNKVSRTTEQEVGDFYKRIDKALKNKNNSQISKEDVIEVLSRDIEQAE